MMDRRWFYEKLDQKGVSLRDMASYIGLDPSSVSRMLKGERKMSADEQDRIAEYLDVSIIDVADRRRGTGGGLEERKQEAYRADDDGESESSLRPAVYDDPSFIHPAYGCMAGTMIIPDDVDLTAPIDADWSETLYNE